MPERYVVCVDDESIILLALRQKLRAGLPEGIRCETAVSAESALELLAELRAGGHRVVAVISDWLMPRMKGDEFLRRVHAEGLAERLILLTGYAEPEMINALEAELALTATFEKPCDVKAVLAAVLAAEP